MPNPAGSRAQQVGEVAAHRGDPGMRGATDARKNRRRSWYSPSDDDHGHGDGDADPSDPPASASTAPAATSQQHRPSAAARAGEEPVLELVAEQPARCAASSPASAPRRRPAPTSGRSGPSTEASTPAAATASSVPSSGPRPRGVGEGEHRRGAERAAGERVAAKRARGDRRPPPAAAGHRVELRPSTPRRRCRRRTVAASARRRSAPAAGRAGGSGAGRRRPPANAPNARISRLSHEWRSPRTARHASSGRPRWRTDAPRATQPGDQADRRASDVGAGRAARSARSQAAATVMPTAAWVSTSITASGRVAVRRVDRRPVGGHPGRRAPGGATGSGWSGR